MSSRQLHAISQKFVPYTYFVVVSWVQIHGSLQMHLYLCLTFPDPQLPADWETLAGNNYLLEELDLQKKILTESQIFRSQQFRKQSYKPDHL